MISTSSLVPNVTMIFKDGDTMCIPLLSLRNMTEYFDLVLLKMAERKQSTSDFIITLFEESSTTVRLFLHAVHVEYPDPEPEEFRRFREKYGISMQGSLLTDEDISDDVDTVLVAEENNSEEFDTTYTLSFWGNRWWSRRSKYKDGFYYHCHERLCQASVYVTNGHAEIIKEHSACCPELEDLEAPQPH